jgi:hypothetical protein
MKRTIRTILFHHGITAILVFSALASVALIADATGQKPDTPTHLSITITQPPPSSEGGTQKMDLIQGKVDGAIPTGARVVIYSFAGDGWWVQPEAAKPYTLIGAGQRWSAVIHLGQVYGALLVTPGFKAEAKLDSLPPEGGDVLAATTKSGR